MDNADVALAHDSESTGVLAVCLSFDVVVLAGTYGALYAVEQSSTDWCVAYLLQALLVER